MAQWIDTHHHLWNTNRTDYGWLTPDLPDLYQSFLVADYENIIDQTPIGASILVQAAPTVAETEYLLSLAQQSGTIQGVIGWVDFDDPQTAVQDIARLSKNPLFKGVRPMLQDIADTDYILNSKFTPVFDSLIDHDLRFEALIFPQGIAAIVKIFETYPNLKSIVNHCAKPQIRDGLQTLAPWTEQMRTVAQMQHVYIKISGLLTEAQPNAMTNDIQPYTDAILQIFDPCRIVWGSDWPVLNLASDYQTWITITQKLLSDLPKTAQNNIKTHNAKRFYNLV